MELAPLKGAVSTSVKVPGSKSYSLRALFIAALCEGQASIDGLLKGEDSEAMKDCIETLGQGEQKLDARESGTTARFMAALCCISTGTQILTGASGLKKRPVADLVDGLRQLGAKIEYIEKEGSLPLKISSSELVGGTVNISGEVSSQYLSALLLIAPKLKNGLVINISGKQISRPYIDMTIEIMSRFGVTVKNHDYKKYEVKPQKYQTIDYTVEADYSSASYFYAINYLTGSDIKVKNMNMDSKQADRRFTDLLAKGKLPPTINGEDFPDQVMTLAVLCAFSDGKYVIEGVKSLRIKETERVRAVENELAKMGIKTESTEDTLTIYGGNPKSACIDTYGDHRIAMSFAVAATKVAGIKILNPGVVNKTFPGFWDELAKITTVKKDKKSFSNLLLIGMRGSGKTTVGELLAKKLDKKFIDMDVYLEVKHDKKVRDIVLDDGWEHFRRLESEACEVISKEKNAVISSGGGIVLDQTNMKRFREDSVFMLLKVDPSVLSRRIRTDKNRPELTTQPTLLGELDQVWEKRKNQYYTNADLIIDTTVDSPEYIVNEIMEMLAL